jgi:hypothetical protein
VGWRRPIPWFSQQQCAGGSTVVDAPVADLLRDEAIKHAFGLGVFAPVNQDKKIKINKIMK